MNTEETEREIIDLKNEVGRLRQEIARLETRVVAGEGEDAAREPVLRSGLGPASPVPTAYPRPFEVDYDAAEGAWYIFAPPGCVLVGGKAVAIKDADEAHTVTLDIDPDAADPEERTDCLWAHVIPDSSSEGGYYVTFDGEEDNDDSEYDFRVMRFGMDETDGDQYDIATSVVNLGGSGGSGGPFPWQVRWDPSLDEGEGNWKIYLPARYGSNDAGGHCLSFKDSYIDHKDVVGLVRVAGPWWQPDPASLDTPFGGAIWLHIVVWDPPNDVEAHIADAPYDDADPIYKREVGGEDVYPMYVVNVCIAEVSLATSEGTTTGTVDAQCVVGALHIGSRVTYE